MDNERSNNDSGNTLSPIEEIGPRSAFDPNTQRSRQAHVMREHLALAGEASIRDGEEAAARQKTFISEVIASNQKSIVDARDWQTRLAKRKAEHKDDKSP